MLIIQKTDLVSTVTLSFKSWDYPDGAIGVRLDTDNLAYRDCKTVGYTLANHQTIERDYLN